MSKHFPLVYRQVTVTVSMKFDGFLSFFMHLFIVTHLFLIHMIFINRRSSKNDGERGGIDISRSFFLYFELKLTSYTKMIIISEKFRVFPIDIHERFLANSSKTNLNIMQSMRVFF